MPCVILVSLAQNIIAQGIPTPPSSFIHDHAEAAIWISTLILIYTISAGLWLHKEFKSLRAADEKRDRAIDGKIKEFSDKLEESFQSRFKQSQQWRDESVIRFDHFEARMATVERQISIYSEHIISTDSKLARIEVGLETAVKAIENQRVENLEAHSEIIQGRVDIFQRITALESRQQLMTAETNISNNKDLIKRLENVLSKLEEQK
jgi:hypothetical protein